MEGYEQSLIIEVVPSTGTCILTRGSETLGASVPGNRVVKVSKSKDDIMFNCSAPGYESRTEVLSSSLSPYTVASFFLLDFGIVDATTGAWKKYPERMTVVMQPAPQAPPPPSRRRP